MKTLYTLFLKLTSKDYDQNIKSAKNITKMIIDSTNGKSNHFYNSNGEKIRGYHKRIKFNPTINQHPLITKYEN